MVHYFITTGDQPNITERPPDQGNLPGPIHNLGLNYVADVGSKKLVSDQTWKH